MCGIAGSWRDWADVDAMLDKIAHRGPDGRGVKEIGDTIHGHVRLAIVDPDPRSDQPFETPAGLLSFNGEIWNYRELREQLDDAGALDELPLVTESDTEVLNRALGWWGVENTLPLLEGMFTFAYTNDDGTWLARDRFGKVPLYVVRRGGGVAWSSERKAFGGWAAESEPLPPGCVWKLGEDQWHEWYSVSGASQPVSAHFPAGQVLERLRAGVEARLMADVPVCSLLSGGLDSSLVLALIKEVKPDVVAFTVFADPESIDLENARAVASHLKVPLIEVKAQFPGEQELSDAVYQIEVTTKTQVEIATLCMPLAKAISEAGFKVCLSGEAADELFGGYGTMGRFYRPGKPYGDKMWRDKRIEWLGKMGRSDFIRVNKAFMSHGVEARLPFLDRNLVEMVLGLSTLACPAEKKLLKQAARDLLPDEIIDRKKVTFQGGAGVKSFVEEAYASPRKLYNDFAREHFGAVMVG